MATKYVGLWNPQAPGTGILAIGMFKDGISACKAVVEYDTMAKAKKIKRPWAKDFDIVVTGHKTGVKFPKIRLDGENLGKLVLP